MAEYIEREAFVEQKRKQYCKDCARRKGMKNGKYKTLYEIGEAPCRACEIDDVLNYVEDFPAADVRPVARGKWIEEMVVGGFAESWESTCSICGKGYRDIGKPHFCPNCGADMREER